MYKTVCKTRVDSCVSETRTLRRSWSIYDTHITVEIMWSLVHAVYLFVCLFTLPIFWEKRPVTKRYDDLTRIFCFECYF